MIEEVKPKREFLSTIYIVKDSKVLLTFNKKVNKFVPLGGHIEENELPCESVVREAKEESGLDIEVVDASGNPDFGEETTTSTGAKRKFLPHNIGMGLDIIKPLHHHINIAYLGKVIGGKQSEKSDEGTELKWFSPEELKKDQETLKNVKQEALKAIDIINNL